MRIFLAKHSLKEKTEKKKGFPIRRAWVKSKGAERFTARLVMRVGSRKGCGTGK